MGRIPGATAPLALFGKELTMHHWKVFGEAVDKYLRPRTPPVAIKLLKSAPDIPKSAQRPLKDLKHRVALCQGFAYARRNGVTLAMLKEDQYCPLGVIVLGLAEPPSYWLKGNTNLGRYAGTPEAAMRIAAETPRFKVGEYIGVATAPLPNTDFDVDAVLTYCNGAQATRFVQAAIYKDGKNLEAMLIGAAACAMAITHTVQTGKCQLVMPCLGDRRYGLTQDDEIAFAVPASRLEEIAVGLENTHKAGIALPIRAVLSWEAQMVGPYLELAKLLGIVKG